MGRKNIYMVLDTETVKPFGAQVPYDVGGVIMDKTGNILHKFSFIVSDYFYNLRLMKTAYFSDKVPYYIEKIAAGETVVRTFKEIITELTDIIDEYKVTHLAAYNERFDERAMENACYECFDNRNWLNREVERICIWGGACDTLCSSRYCKAARENGWVSEAGNILTNAEVVYKYISGAWDFLEEHTALSDAEIEAEILTAILKRKTKTNFSVRYNPWQEVQRREKVSRREENGDVCKMLVFDMDGTIADLFGIENWLETLKSGDTSPYRNAAPLVNMEKLRETCNTLKAQGWEIRVCSALLGGASPEYKKEIRKAKKEWLTAYNFPADKIHFVKYQGNKSHCISRYNPTTAILLDDSYMNRKQWKHGETVNPNETDIVRYLMELAGI